MNIPLLKPAALLTTALLCAGPAFAQVKTEPQRPVPPKAAPAPSAPSASPVPMPSGVTVFGGVPATPAPRKLTTLTVPDTELEGAVQLLQSTLEGSGLEQLNILFGPETKNLEVTALTLRNVTGPDALQLIAAAAGCTVEPMFSTETQTPPGLGFAGNHKVVVIGYQLRGKPKTTTTSRMGGASPMLPPGASAAPGMSAGAAGGLAMMSGPGAMMSGRPLSATSPASRVTRIYPLGSVTGLKTDYKAGSSNTRDFQLDRYFRYQIDFPELEKTLRDALKADGVAENQITLAFHEKSNVLVVNGAEAIQGLIEQVLAALRSNATEAEAKNMERDKVLGRTELEAAVNARERLSYELTRSREELQMLQKALRKFEDAAPKPPSAK